MDRLDSKGHYTIDNIQWVHKKINFMKLHLPQKEFIYYCQLVNNKIKDNNPIYNIITRKPRYKFTGNISGIYKGSIIGGAKDRNIPFYLDWDFVWNKYIEQNGRCYYTGLPIDFPENPKDIKLYTASLDRTDSSKGYFNNNICWVHKYINLMKGNMIEEDFKNWCKLVSDYQKVVIYV